MNDESILGLKVISQTSKYYKGVRPKLLAARTPRADNDRRS